MLQFQSVTKRFGPRAAVDRVSLTIGHGEIFSLLGPSGCGKTTLLRMAAGFESPDAGRILLADEDITELPPNRRALNTIFQNYALFPHLNVRRNIAFGPRLAGWTKARIADETDRLLHLVQLESHADHKPDTLSGGQKQRVALARALILKPRILLLDEPFAALDLQLRRRMLLELERLQREIGVTFVFVTHDQTEAMSISHRVAVMADGRILQSGTPREIYDRPANRCVAAFIGDANLLNGVLNAGDSGLHLATEAGPRIPIHQTEPWMTTGTAATLCLRPEHLTLCTAEPPAEPGREALLGTVRDAIYLGTHTQFVVAAADRDWIALQHHGGPGEARFLPSIGDDLWLTFDHRHCRPLPNAPHTTPPPNEGATP
ncbi:ABC transporter ATP-binding protein [Sulfidibacter corallicola]|uniref:ABC transporter ATP-binding protein n=1 Tax=Sulfidibacter corallicola TaxID=2818388 RepID=A0A8A4TVF1_SULCO|nr:ABC transporter ATP-binding protein [Sulfidibacter corallicola]QTD50505.1 ABC transporter ATP-binding protein [Sulfidibacter corallicola]